MGTNEALLEAAKATAKTKSITAASARQLCKHPDRLLNSIFKSIKDSAEFGANRTSFIADDLSGSAIDYVETNLSLLGFSVSTSTNCFVRPGSTSSSNTIFEISWKDPNPSSPTREYHSNQY